MSSKGSNLRTTKTRPAKLKNSTMRPMTRVASTTSMDKLEASGRKQRLPSKEVMKMEKLLLVDTRNRATSIMSILSIIPMLMLANMGKRNMLETVLFMVLIMELTNTVFWDIKRTADSTNTTHTCLFTESRCFF